jgi:ABC-type multidrug transport system ATPase subunit
VALCRILLEEPDMLLLDEPTNHLDAESVAWLEQHLARFPGTIVAITHDRYFLDNVAQWILELDRGEGFPYEGNYSSWLEQKQARLAREEKQASARSKTLERELEWIRMSPRARQSKGKARISAFEELSSEAQKEQVRTAEILIPKPERLGEDVVIFDGVTKGYGDKLLMENLSFRLPRGGIVGVIGPNGAGKTTTFRMIVGEEQPDSGTITVGSTVKLSYVDQSRDALNPEKTVWEEVSGGLDMLDFGWQEVNSRAYLSWFNFRGGEQQKKVGVLSGGERNRVHLAKLLKSGGNVMLLDEPTNDLDVDTLRALEEAMLGFPGCAVIISHDRWFLDRVATHILAFEGDSQVVWYEGNYQDYEEDRKRRLGPEALQPHRIKYRKLVRRAPESLAEGGQALVPAEPLVEAGGEVRHPPRDRPRRLDPGGPHGACEEPAFLAEGRRELLGAHLAQGPPEVSRLEPHLLPDAEDLRLGELVGFVPSLGLVKLELRGPPDDPVELAAPERRGGGVSGCGRAGHGEKVGKPRARRHGPEKPRERVREAFHTPRGYDSFRNEPLRCLHRHGRRTRTRPRRGPGDPGPEPEAPAPHRGAGARRAADGGGGPLLPGHPGAGGLDPGGAPRGEPGGHEKPPGPLRRRGGARGGRRRRADAGRAPGPDLPVPEVSVSARAWPRRPRLRRPGGLVLSLLLLLGALAPHPAHGEDGDHREAPAAAQPAEDAHPGHGHHGHEDPGPDVHEGHGGHDDPCPRGNCAEGSGDCSSTQVAPPPPPTAPTAATRRSAAPLPPAADPDPVLAPPFRPPRTLPGTPEPPLPGLFLR